MKLGKIIQHHCKKKKSQTVFLLDKIKQFKQEYYPDTKKKVLLIWDNAGCHKSEEVKQWLRDNLGVVELDNFPPYSPEMNPIEHVWKTLKKHINHMRGESPLTEIMQEAKLFLDEKTFNYKLFGQKYCKNILEKHPYAIR